jgi:hypothetical protein
MRRLDAIGAVGIARCFTFGGRFSRTLYDPDVPPRENLTQEQYMASGAKEHTINHFYEKLLKLKVSALSWSEASVGIGDGVDGGVCGQQQPTAAHPSPMEAKHIGSD